MYWADANCESMLEEKTARTAPGGPWPVRGVPCRGSPGRRRMRPLAQQGSDWADSAAGAAFLNGPMAILLTNTSGFSCHVVMTTGSPPIPGETVSGNSCAGAPELLFAPDAHCPAGKRFARSGFSFIWDVAAQHGYLLSEALQGYAPISSAGPGHERAGPPSRSASEVWMAITAREPKSRWTPATAPKRRSRSGGRPI